MTVLCSDYQRVITFDQGSFLLSLVSIMSPNEARKNESSGPGYPDVERGVERSNGADKLTRRTILRSAGVLAGTSAVVPAIADASDDPLAAFRVRGRKTTQVTYRPDEITVTIRKQSPDLKRRYDIDPPVYVKEKTFDRHGAEEDGLPERGTDTFREDWDTYLATEDEWRGLGNGRSDDEVSIQHSHSWQEDYWTYAAWIYEQHSCNRCRPTYERTSPINVIYDLGGTSIDIYDVDDVFDNVGWDAYITEYTRYAWNSITERFVSQQLSRATDQYGALDDRDHVRFWQFGDYVSMQAHRDTGGYPHTVDSYEEAEGLVRYIFDNAGWYLHSKSYYPLYNNKDPDHDGYASRITRW